MTATAQTDWPQQAGILCNDDRFQQFVAERMSSVPLIGGQVTGSAAAEYLRRFCNIASRRELATDIDARARFWILRTEFDAWSGRIASPR